MEDMQDPNVYRTLGEHGARLAALEASSNAANQKLDVLLQRSAEQKGERGMLWRIGSISGGLAGFIVGVATWWASRGDQ